MHRYPCGVGLLEAALKHEDELNVCPLEAPSNTWLLWCRLKEVKQGQPLKPASAGRCDPGCPWDEKGRKPWRPGCSEQPGWCSECSVAQLPMAHGVGEACSRWAKSTGSLTKTPIRSTDARQNKAIPCSCCPTFLTCCPLLPTQTPLWSFHHYFTFWGPVGPLWNSPRHL